TSERAPDLRDEIARRVILRVAGNRDTNPEGGRDLPFGDGVRLVVGPLAVDVGPQLPQERLDVGPVEDGDERDAGASGDQLGALGLRDDRPAGALQRAGRDVGVHGDDEAVGLGGGRLEVAEVADVEEVEEAVRERYRAPRVAPESGAREEIGAADDLRAGAHALTEARIAAVSSAGRIVTVPYFITARPAVTFARVAASAGEAPGRSASVNVATTVSPAPGTSATPPEPKARVATRFPRP